MTRRAAADELLREHGETFAEECGVGLRRGTAAPLWQLLCAALLYGARIRSTIATRAVQGLLRGGLGTAERMRTSSWDERVRILDEAGYARYDERTPTTSGRSQPRSRTSTAVTSGGCASEPATSRRRSEPS